jgi:hypothetical protein
VDEIVRRHRHPAEMNHMALRLEKGDFDEVKAVLERERIG